MINNLQTPTKCECGNDKFYVELLEYPSSSHPSSFPTDISGILYQCTECGYIHTAWRD